MPKEASSLNYRIIGFSFPKAEKADGYVLEVVEGRAIDVKQFEKLKKVVVVKSENTKIIAEVPSFGKDYTWRVLVNNEKLNKEHKQLLHHFTTMFCDLVDSSLFRFRILNSAVNHKDAYVFLDATKAIYNMKGKPVWFLPSTVAACEFSNVSNICLSPTSSITFMNDRKGEIQEVNYNANVLWSNKITSDSLSSDYHHDFCKLANGNYMAIKTEYEYWLLNGKVDVRSKNGQIGDTSLYQHIPFSKLVEYNSAGEKVWEWKESKYFLTSDIHNMVNAEGTFTVDPHVNAFYVDEVAGYVYLSYKVINRVVKVKYPEGYVVNDYGPSFSAKEPDMTNELFCGQHSCKVNRDGDLYLFNNNSCQTTQLPKLILMSQPDSASNKLTKKWEFTCSKELIPVKLKDQSFGKGGNVISLQNGDFFASLNAPYSLVFIVSQSKKIMWSALAETYDVDNHVWQPIRLYRANIIESKIDFEKLVWNQ